MYKQSAPVNHNVPYTGGMCERYAENTVGLSGIFPSAIDAWNSNMGNHPGELPPKGIKVAVYFTLGKVPAGHVAISLGDGRVASSTQGGYHTSPVIHPSLQNLIDTYSNPAYGNGKCTYLGWSEFIGKKRVVSKGEEMVTNESCYNAFNGIRMRPPTQDELKQFVGKWQLESLVAALMQGKERENVVEEWRKGKFLSGETDKAAVDKLEKIKAIVG